MKKLRDALLVASFATAVTLGGTVAYATEISAGGGTWRYGYFRPVSAYSNYHHPSNQHGAKVVNRNNGISATGRGNAGAWAKASIGTIWDPASFYYNPTGFY